MMISFAITITALVCFAFTVTVTVIVCRHHILLLGLRILRRPVLLRLDPYYPAPGTMSLPKQPHKMENKKISNKGAQKFIIQIDYGSRARSFQKID